MKKYKRTGWAAAAAVLIVTGGCCPTAADMTAAESRRAETDPIAVCEVSTAEKQKEDPSVSKREETAESAVRESENIRQEKEDETYIDKSEPVKTGTQERETESTAGHEPETVGQTEKETEKAEPESSSKPSAAEESPESESESGLPEYGESTEVLSGEDMSAAEEESEEDPVVISSAEAESTESAAQKAVIVYEMLDLVNRERQSQGLPSVSWNTALEDGCRIRAAELAVSFSHQRPDQSSGRTAYSVNIMAENAGENGRSAESMLQDWLASAAHRGTILGREARTICCARYQAGRQYYWILVNTD